jgi:arabinogalactan endo-1,4-beta-galactosidase
MRTTRIVALAVFVVVFTACHKSNTVNEPAPPIPPTVTDTFVRGADISWLTQMESSGRKFYNSAGTEQDCIQILKALGMNTIRLRVWVDPLNGWNGQNDVIAKAVRAKNLGMKVMIDFHYSDSWADPGQQTKPAAWSSLDFASLKQSLISHTSTVLNGLKSAGVTPAWVQVGNETDGSTLFTAV